MKVKTALISVSNKEGLLDFAKTLAKLKIKILSTGGTANFLKTNGIEALEISQYTGAEEMLDGRVKTLHPKIHAGILALRNNKLHLEALKKHNIIQIDMVVVNLYPFAKVIQKKDVKLNEAVENIDIGGPSMIRGAAKNYQDVAVVVSPSQYLKVAQELSANNCELNEKTLSELALEAFRTTSSYDLTICSYLSNKFSSFCDFPEKLNINLTKQFDLRYGENPHQKASFYLQLQEDGMFSKMKQLHGKQLSFNNILDLYSAFDIACEFNEPTAAIVKHTTPCGIASATNLLKAYKDALSCDPISAFGGIVGFNGKVTKQIAKFMLEKGGFVECVAAPSYDKDAVETLKEKKNLRLIQFPLKYKKSNDIKCLNDGFLIQKTDALDYKKDRLEVVTKKKPTKKQLKELVFAWKTVKFIKSNAIVICKGTKTVGIGGGQPSRVGSVKIASEKAAKRAANSVLASDAFFPQPDSIKIAGKNKIKAIIQPGGSIRDKEVIGACNKYGIAMVFTGIRHFRH